MNNMKKFLCAFLTLLFIISVDISCSTHKKHLKHVTTLESYTIDTTFTAIGDTIITKHYSYERNKVSKTQLWSGVIVSSVTLVAATILYLN